MTLYLGPNKYDALFDQLASQIDQLPDDGEEDGGVLRKICLVH